MEQDQYHEEKTPSSGLKVNNYSDSHYCALKIQKF